MHCKASKATKTQTKYIIGTGNNVSTEEIMSYQTKLANQTYFFFIIRHRRGGQGGFDKCQSFFLKAKYIFGLGFGSFRSLTMHYLSLSTDGRNYGRTELRNHGRTDQAFYYNRLFSNQS